MDGFCGSNFWDSKTVWDTDDPDLTLCFEKTVLVWIPCAFLWLLLPVEIYHLRHSKTLDIPFNLYNVTKLVAIFLLAATSLTDIVHNAIFYTDYFPVDFYSPLIRFVNFVIFFGLTFANMKFGRRSSAVLFIFSLTLVIFGAPQLRTEFRLEWSKDDKPPKMEFISYLIYYALVVMVFLMNCFADSRPKIAPRPFDKNECPENHSSFLSRVVFAWFEPMVWKGYKKPLEDEDLWNLDYSLSSACNVPKFEKHWNRLLEEIRNSDQLNIKMMAERGRNSIGGIRYKCDEKKKRYASIVPTLFRTFGSAFVKGTLLKIFLDVFIFVNPQLLSLLIDFIGSNESMWKGYLYAILLFLAVALQTLMSSQYQHMMYTIGLKMRTCLISILYKKSLRISNGTRKDFTVGETVNFMSVDTSRFVDLLSYSYLFISTPLQVVLAIFFLFQILGLSVLAGLIIMIISILLNIYIGSEIKSCQFKQMKGKDSRIKLMNQILSGIKVLKLYAWEPSYEKRVLSVRNEEMKVLRKQAYLTGIATFSWSSTSFLVSMSTFAVFVLSSDKNILDAKIVFVTLSLFNTLKLPLLTIPQMISSLAQASVSVKRINKFLNSQDMSLDEVTHEKRAEALVIENASFSWEEFVESPTLRDINVKINPGALVAVVGPVGSGKSSLISTFLGEMYKLSGVVNTIGSIAYVPQQAWIRNTTVKDNITLEEPIRSYYYDQVLEACALKPDLKIFPAGDLTEIGEKGINLSGGQKQRLSLARAVYNMADIYLLDDPLSAVDSHVGKHLFEKVIGPNGLLKEKTRVLVTHCITYLTQVDLIIVLKEGSISECGSFQELLDKQGDFADFLTTYLEENPDCEEEDLKQLEETLMKKRVSIVPPRHGSFDNSMDSSALCKKRKSVVSTKDRLTKKRETKVDVKEDIIGQRLTEVEHTERRNMSWSVYAYYMKSAGFIIVSATLFGNFSLQVFSFATSVWLTKWTDDSNAITPEGTQNIDIRNFYLLIYAVLGLSKSVVEFISDTLLRVACWISAKVVHNSMLSNILRLPLSFMDVTPSGRILSRFSGDVDVVDNIIHHLFSCAIFCVGDVICNLAIVSFSTPNFITILLPITILFCIAQRFYIATSRQLKRLESVSRSPMYSHFVETVVGAPSIRAYDLTEKFIKQSEEKVDHYHKSFYLNIVSNRWLAVRAEMISNMVIFFAALFAILDRDSISPGVAGLSIGYTLQITVTLSWSIFKISELQTNIVSVERIKEYSEKPQEAAWKLPNEQIPKNWPSKGDIDFQDFKVRYREGLEMVLKGVTFSVGDGQKVGIVGRTGAGKSSLTLSLFRILESAGGKIMIDGVDIATLGLHTLRSKLTIIPQDPILFSGSLHMNLDPFDEYSDESLWRALELAHLKSYISTLDNGLRCEVTEGGENFSVGQRQLICLARALLRKTKILILDEATAAVDLKTDELIQNTIRKEFQECTVLTIAHRLNTVMDYDKILVVDEGIVAEYDSPQTLLKSKSSLFYRMAVDAGLV